MTLSQLVLALVVGLASGMISYLTASGMSLIISGMGTINFGQGAFYILGAMLCYYSVRANVPFIAALLIVLPGPCSHRCTGGISAPAYIRAGHDLQHADHDGCQLHAV